MKKIWFILFLLHAVTAKAQIAGDSVVCSGYIYTYNASIPGAVSYQWYFPSGWYDSSGQATAQLIVTCNVSDGDVCVEGFDSNGTSIGVECITTAFGGAGGSGWWVYPPGSIMCEGSPVSLTVEPDTSGGGGNCPPGCGNGMLHPNQVFAVYDDQWPAGNFLGLADGSNFYIPPVLSTILYVYQVDTTDGTTPGFAVLISGGCGAGSISNEAIITQAQPKPYPFFTQDPATVCVGDTFELTENYCLNFSTPVWSNPSGVSILGSVNDNPITLVVTGRPAYINITAVDNNGCPLAGMDTINFGICGPPLSTDSIVCPGHVYAFSTNVPGATYYQWTFPAGWYDVTGQGTSQVTATCNVNVGDVCVEAFDFAMLSLGTQCFETFWGDGAVGWDVQPDFVGICENMPFALGVNPNGTGAGNCPPGCGNGTLHPNIGFAVYDAPWPTGNFLGLADNTNFTIPINVTSMYIYSVDYSLGYSPGLAVLIEGGCAGIVTNNVVNVSQFHETEPGFIQMDTLACAGDTIQISETYTGACGFVFWTNPINCTILGSVNANPVTVVINGNPAYITFDGLDCYGCDHIGQDTIEFASCGLPVAALTADDTSVCPGACTNFQSLSTNAISYQWYFEGAIYDTSTAVNPNDVCYISPGTYDVQLIVTNTSGSDTLLLPDYITVYPFPPGQAIFQSNDTLFAVQNAVSYQWYYNFNIIPGATEYFYVAQLSGDYHVSAFDTNGCEVQTGSFNVIVGLHSPGDQSGLVVFPNPAENQLEVYGLRSSIGRVHIYNMLGESYISVQKSSVDSLKIDITNLPNGSFIAEIISGNKIFRKKFIKGCTN